MRGIMQYFKSKNDAMFIESCDNKRITNKVK